MVERGGDHRLAPNGPRGPVINGTILDFFDMLTVEIAPRPGPHPLDLVGVGGIVPRVLVDVGPPAEEKGAANRRRSARCSPRIVGVEGAAQPRAPPASRDADSIALRFSGRGVSALMMADAVPDIGTRISLVGSWFLLQGAAGHWPEKNVSGWSGRGSRLLDHDAEGSGAATRIQGSDVAHPRWTSL